MLTERLLLLFQASIDNHHGEPQSAIVASRVQSETTLGQESCIDCCCEIFKCTAKFAKGQAPTPSTDLHGTGLASQSSGRRIHTRTTSPNSGKMKRLQRSSSVISAPRIRGSNKSSEEHAQGVGEYSTTTWLEAREASRHGMICRNRRICYGCS